MKELEIQKKCVILRNGSEIWMSSEKADQLGAEDKGILIRVSELDRHINTADIIEICTALQMDSKRRISGGEYQCQYKKWHLRRERCTCFRDRANKAREILKLKEIENGSKPLTAAQKKQRAKNIKKNREWAKKHFGNKQKKDSRENFFSESIKYSKDGKCVVCRKKKLPLGCANVCDGVCKSKRDKNPEKYEKLLVAKK